jgi:hypothetical protein
MELLSGLGHEMLSSAQTLGLWVRIPLEAWMSVCLFRICVALAVSGLATGPIPVQVVLPTVYKSKISLCLTH